MGFVATVLLVRALSEHDYGVYNLLYSVIALIGVIASFGIGNTLQRFIPEYYEKGEFRIANNLYRTSSLIRLISNVAILSVILLLWEYVSPHLKIAEYRKYFIIFAVVILLHMQRGILETCLSSYFLHKYSKSIGFLFTLIKAIGYGCVIVFEKSLQAAIMIDITAYVVVFALLQMIYAKKIPHSTGNLEQFSQQEKKRVAKYALFYNFNDAGVGLLDANFDNFIIVMYLNPVAVGAYSFCVRLSRQINRLLPLSYFLDVIRPAFFTYGTASAENNTTFFFQSLIKVNAIITIPCFFFLLLYSEDIITVVFGCKFIEYSFVLAGVFFFTALNSFQPAVGLIAQLREKADIILYSKFFAAYNLIADIILIKILGIWGAVIATGSAIMCKNFFVWYFVRADASFKGMEKFFAKILTFWTAISLVVMGLDSLIALSPFFTLILGIVLFSLFFLTQFKLNYFSVVEEQTIEKILSGKPVASFFKKLLLNQ